MTISATSFLEFAHGRLQYIAVGMDGVRAASGITSDREEEMFFLMWRQRHVKTYFVCAQ